MNTVPLRHRGAPQQTRRSRTWFLGVLPFLLLALLLALLAPLAAAQAAPGTTAKAPKTLQFGIGPANHVPAKQVVDGRPYLVYSANPGATIIDRFALFNYGRAPLTLQVYATDAVQSDTGAFGLLPGDATPSDAGSWIKLLGVPAGGTVTVPGRTGKAYGVLRIKFIARIPLKATPGDHVGGLIASLKSTSTNTKGAKITLDQRIGLRAYFSLSGKLEPKVAVEDLRASYTNQWDPLGRGLYRVSYYLHNTGNLRVDVGQEVRIERCIIPGILCPAGDLVGHPATQPDLLPGTRIKVVETFAHRFGLGRPSATVTLHLSANDKSYRTAIPDTSTSTRFWALPWLLILELVLVLLLLAGSGWWFERRRRRQRAERELLASMPAPKHAAPLDPAPEPRGLRRRFRRPSATDETSGSNE